MHGLTQADALRMVEQQAAAERNRAALSRWRMDHDEHRSWTDFLDEIAYVRDVCGRYLEHAGATYRAVYPVRPVERRTPSPRLLAQFAIGGSPSAEADRIVRDWLDGLDSIRSVNRFRSSGGR